MTVPVRAVHCAFWVAGFTEQMPAATVLDASAIQNVGALPARSGQLPLQLIVQKPAGWQRPAAPAAVNAHCALVVHASPTNFCATGAAPLSRGNVLTSSIRTNV